LLQGNLAIHKTFKYLKRKIIPLSAFKQIDSNNKSFFNLNTPEDLKIATEIVDL